MPTLPLILAFTAVALTTIFLPGPDMLYLFSQSVARGRKAGMLAALGIASGLTVHFTLAAVGLSALLVNSPMLFGALRFIGAGYLLYLAWKIVRAPQEGGAATETPQAVRGTSARVFLRGVLTNLLNPKAFLFVLALLPQFLRAENGSPLTQTAFFGAEFVTLEALIYLGLAVLFARLGRRVTASPRLRFVQRWGTGSLFAGSAIWLMAEA